MTSGFAAMVTGPFDKETLDLEGHSSPSNTEVFAALSATKNYAMMLSKNFWVIHISAHVSIRMSGYLIKKIGCSGPKQLLKKLF
jgi:4-phospho-D-threonate 3-dehydrogenase / 4-phospho-D-erythronate 3-dehydrogenase